MNEDSKKRTEEMLHIAKTVHEATQPAKDPEPARRPRNEKEVRVMCAYPECNKTRLLPKSQADAGKDETGLPIFCVEHRDQLKFLLWVIPKIQIERNKTTGGLIVPGHKDFGSTFRP